VDGIIHDYMDLANRILKAFLETTGLKEVYFGNHIWKPYQRKFILEAT
jgi:hypothetical protein